MGDKMELGAELIREPRSLAGGDEMVVSAGDDENLLLELKIGDAILGRKTGGGNELAAGGMIAGATLMGKFERLAIKLAVMADEEKTRRNTIDESRWQEGG